MNQFLPHFIKFGCMSNQYLAAVSIWPSTHIQLFLDKVSENSDGPHFLEMDKFILETQFLSYFKVSCNVISKYPW